MKTLFFLIALSFSFSLFAQNTFVDTRDNHEYKTVKIGDQVWFAENFAYKPEKGNFWAYDDKQNAATFGFLYDWETANQIAPKGWHLPTNEEFETLLNFLGGDESYEAFLALKEGGTSGFNTLKSGYYWYGEGYRGINELAIFWTSTADDNEYSWVCQVGAEGEVASMSVNDKKSGLSVRFIKD